MAKEKEKIKIKEFLDLPEGERTDPWNNPRICVVLEDGRRGVASHEKWITTLREAHKAGAPIEVNTEQFGSLLVFKNPAAGQGRSGGGGKFNPKSQFVIAAFDCATQLAVANGWDARKLVDTAKYLRKEMERAYAE